MNEWFTDMHDRARRAKNILKRCMRRRQIEKNEGQTVSEEIMTNNLPELRFKNPTNPSLG